MSYLSRLILDVSEPEQSKLELQPDGRIVEQTQIVFTEEGFEWLRSGILCIRCLHDLRPSGSFPQRCPACGFPVRDLQLQKLERDFGGQVLLGSKVSLADELARLGELQIPEGGI